MNKTDREIIIPDVIQGMVYRMKAKSFPQYQRDNARRTLEDIRSYIDKAIKSV